MGQVAAYHGLTHIDFALLRQILDVAGVDYQAARPCTSPCPARTKPDGDPSCDHGPNTKPPQQSARVFSCQTSSHSGTAAPSRPTNCS